MTDRAHWAKMLPIIQAFVEGKEIEYLSCDTWLPVTDRIHFVHDPSDYRIKPEPIVEEWRAMPSVYCRGNRANNLRLTFDPDTKELIAAEIIK